MATIASVFGRCALSWPSSSNTRTEGCSHGHGSECTVPSLERESFFSGQQRVRMTDRDSSHIRHGLAIWTWKHSQTLPAVHTLSCDIADIGDRIDFSFARALRMHESAYSNAKPDHPSGGIAHTILILQCCNPIASHQQNVRRQVGILQV